MSGVFPAQLGESIVPAACCQNQTHALNIALMLAYVEEVNIRYISIIMFLMFLALVAWKMYCPGYPSISAHVLQPTQSQLHIARKMLLPIELLYHFSQMPHRQWTWLAGNSTICRYISDWNMGIFQPAMVSSHPAPALTRVKCVTEDHIWGLSKLTWVLICDVSGVPSRTWY